MPDSFPGEIEKDFSFLEGSDIESTLHRTAPLNIDILLLGKPAQARIRWPNEYITCRDDEVTSLP